MSAITDQTGKTAASFDGTGNFGGSTNVKNIVAERKITFGDATRPCMHIMRDFVFSTDPTADDTNYNDDIAPVGSEGILLGSFNAATGKAESAVKYVKTVKASAGVSGFKAVTTAA